MLWHALMSWQTVYLRTNCLHHDVYLTLWLFGLMTNPLTRFLSFCLILGTKYNENVFLMSLRTLWCHRMFLMLWRTFWRLWRIFDIPFDTITFFYFISKHLTHFWRHDKPFDVITCFDINTCFWRCNMANVLTFDAFLTSWQIFWRHDVFLT